MDEERPRTDKPKLICKFLGKILSKGENFRRDVHSPWLRDICVLPSEIILVTDFSNGLKAFNSRGNIVSKLPLPGPPNSITQLDVNTVAITISFDCDPTTVLVDIKDITNMKILSKISTDINYRGIAAISELAWAASTSWWNGAGSIDVLNREGKVIQSFNDPSGTKTLLQCATYMYVSPSGHLIASDCNAKAIVCLHPNGSIRFCFSGEKEKILDLPLGVCCDPNGNMYIADGNLHTVIVLNENGTFSHTLLNAEDGLEKPWGVFIYSGKLYIAEKEGMVKIFEL